MVVIIADINGSMVKLLVDAIKLKKFYESLAIDKPVNVTTPEDLAIEIERYKDQSCLLFSNFPPDSSYTKDGRTLKTVNDDGYLYPAWKSYSYSKTTSLFEKLGSGYHFNYIHFITGAPEDNISDEKIISLFPGSPVSVTRKKEWLQPGLDYNQLYVKFLTKKIEEEVLKNRSSKK